ncbi:MAG: aminopeptidase [Clostridia bacterium]|nr:aminopeptidase [Clostridia bacterium]
MNKARLRKYAKLIATCGVNVQKGQEVIITAELDQPEFIAMVVDECYKRGASKVSVDWSYQPLTKYHVRYCKDKVLGSLDDWQLKKWEHMADTLPCRIYITSEDPDGLRGVNQKKYAKAMASRSKLIKPIRNRMENKYQWCIAAAPGKDWAKKVFPGERASVATEKLWEAILTASRVLEDPIAEWDKHNKNLAERCEYLNSLGIKELYYKSKNGTDFRVGLIPDAIFMAGGEKTLGGGVYYNPNIPSEEAFTSPMRGDADGIVYSSMPLSYGGQLIENFWMRFENGRAVEVGAEKGEELLREMISMDEGASYLGEVALVPYSSPIRESGILFYNTLFDENAACHLAIGRGFTNVLRDYEKYTEDEAHAKGVNDSITHVDFMIGTKDLSIIAKTFDGKEVKIFENGEWA